MIDDLVIACDAKRALNNMTGLGNYSRLVIESVAREYPNAQYLLYAPKIRDNPRMEAIEQLTNVEYRIKQSQTPGALWRTFTVWHELKEERPDIYHGLSNELPLTIRYTRLPSVVTIHDLIYRRLPQCYSAIDRALYDFKYSRSCRLATRIIAVSRRTAKDIEEIYGIDPQKIDVVYQGCDPIFARRPTEGEISAVRSKYGLGESPFILQVGTVERRKNLKLTIRALAALPPDVMLAVAGRPSGRYGAEARRLARELGVAGRVKYIQGAPMADLAVLNHAASAAAYPSYYEGFGIPVLEAITAGTPVVAATGSCLEEAGGNAALYVSPDDPRAMAEALGSILDGSADLGKMKEEAARHSARFDINNLASQVMNVYQKAVEEHTCR